VKATAHPIAKYLVFTFLSIYLFTVTAYIIFHPKYIVTNFGIVTINGPAAHGHSKNNPGNVYFTQLHGAFKTIIENKGKAISLLICTIGVLFILVFNRLAVFCRKGKLLNFFNSPLFALPRHYLSLCTLRI
jgi:hypothetical protein